MIAPMDVIVLSLFSKQYARMQYNMCLRSLFQQPLSEPPLNEPSNHISVKLLLLRSVLPTHEGATFKLLLLILFYSID